MSSWRRTVTIFRLLGVQKREKRVVVQSWRALLIWHHHLSSCCFHVITSTSSIFSTDRPLHPFNPSSRGGCLSGGWMYNTWWGEACFNDREPQVRDVAYLLSAAGVRPPLHGFIQFIITRLNQILDTSLSFCLVPNRCSVVLVWSW